ncbi:fumarylacetoacetate hydrolase family protein [Haloferax sp. YSSS75]|uniref:fumarylacetoacetate hydrolase family protein n=1 Tax=Haloferax sp. YSSS75 TaxID=3388564 RepID=UPI00398D4238
MRFVRYTSQSNPQWGIERDGRVYPLSELGVGGFQLEELTNPSYRSACSRALDKGGVHSLPADDVNYLAPVPNPGQIICVGMNYHDHAEEQNESVPDEPLLFGKSPSSVTNPGNPIIRPDGADLDYEVELGVVIGKTAQNVSADVAQEYVAGYTVINDVSDRKAQFEDGQWFRGKSFDTFAPMGPTLVTGDSIDPNAVDVECRVNGEVMQESNTAEFIFNVGQLVEYISGVTTLRPGDVISTGTPGGVGIFRDPPELLHSGDKVDVRIEGIGTLSNSVVG